MFESYFINNKNNTHINNKNNLYFKNIFFFSFLLN